MLETKRFRKIKSLKKKSREKKPMNDWSTQPNVLSGNGLYLDADNNKNFILKTCCPENIIIKKELPQQGHRNILQARIYSDINGQNYTMIEHHEAHRHFSLKKLPNILNSTTRTPKYVFQELVRAINHLHRNGVAHQNLCLQVIVYDKSTPNILLENSAARSPRRKPYFECPMAPRRTNSEYSRDLWSLGVILYMLYTGVPPYKLANSKVDSDYATLAAFGVATLLNGVNPTAEAWVVKALQSLLTQPEARYLPLWVLDN